MNIFDNEFQEYITWKVGVACDEVEDEKKLKEVRDQFDIAYDIIYNSLNKKQKKNFDDFLTIVWEESKIEKCIAYKVGITDREELNRYKILNDKSKEGAK